MSLFPFSDEKTEGKKLSHLSKLTQGGNGRVGTGTQVIWLQGLSSWRGCSGSRVWALGGDAPSLRGHSLNDGSDHRGEFYGAAEKKGGHFSLYWDGVPCHLYTKQGGHTHVPYWASSASRRVRAKWYGDFGERDWKTKCLRPTFWRCFNCSPCTCINCFIKGNFKDGKAI